MAIASPRLELQPQLAHNCEMTPAHLATITFNMASSPLPDRTATEVGSPIPDDEHEADLPLTMTASVVLTNLPRDTTAALASAGAFDKEKGTPK